MTTYIGIDISKVTFDAAKTYHKYSHDFANTFAGFKKFIQWLNP